MIDFLVLPRKLATRLNSTVGFSLRTDPQLSLGCRDSCKRSRNTWGLRHIRRRYNKSRLLSYRFLSSILFTLWNRSTFFTWIVTSFHFRLVVTSSSVKIWKANTYNRGKLPPPPLNWKLKHLNRGIIARLSCAYFVVCSNEWNDYR